MDTLLTHDNSVVWVLGILWEKPCNKANLWAIGGAGSIVFLKPAGIRLIH